MVSIQLNMKKTLIQLMFWALKLLASEVVLKKDAIKALNDEQDSHNNTTLRELIDAQGQIARLMTTQQSHSAGVAAYEETIAKLKDEMRAKVSDAMNILPESMVPFEADMLALCKEEEPLVHGSVDLLGDSWLKFRRVAVKFKKAHPEVPKADVFRGIVIIHSKLKNV